MDQSDCDGVRGQCAPRNGSKMTMATAAEAADESNNNNNHGDAVAAAAAAAAAVNNGGKCLQPPPPAPPPPPGAVAAVDPAGGWKWEHPPSPGSHPPLLPPVLPPVMAGAAAHTGMTQLPPPPPPQHLPHHLHPPPPPPPPSYTELGVKGSSNVHPLSHDCAHCGDPISDRFLLEVGGRAFHANCLRCAVCACAMDTHSTCFLREEQIYCKHDYAKLFGAKCYKCVRAISPTDWVRKAREQVYHLACFACDACKRQLSTGEEFGIHENRVLCKAHYMEILDGGCTSSDAESNESENHPSKSKKTKRMRTTFTEEQIQILQANFQIDSNPDGQDLERIAQITGLSKRVTQVWFQNCRARQKKYMNTGKARGGGGSGGAKSKPVVPLSGLSPVAREQCSTPQQQQQQLDLHVMYSAFRAQQPAPSIDSNPDELSSSSTDANAPPGFMRGEV